MSSAADRPCVALGPPGVRDEGEGLDEDGEEGEGRRQQRVLVEELDPGVGAGVPCRDSGNGKTQDLTRKLAGYRLSPERNYIQACAEKKVMFC